MKEEEWKVFDWVIAPAGIAFVLIFSFMAAGVAARRWALGIKEQEAIK